MAFLKIFKLILAFKKLNKNFLIKNNSNNKQINLQKI